MIVFDGKVYWSDLDSAVTAPLFEFARIQENLRIRKELYKTCRQDLSTSAEGRREEGVYESNYTTVNGISLVLEVNNILC
jgi:hypothetical protein